MTAVNSNSCVDSSSADREASGRTVCVTGANGFIASWLVAQLLDQGYTVRGTVRSPENEDKNGHLWKLKGADQRLKLYKADILDYEALAGVVAGCEGVFHVASPTVPDSDDHQKEMVDCAVAGVVNCLEACAAAGVKRVILMSSILACMYNRGQDASKVPDENDWADAEFFKERGSDPKTFNEVGAWYTVGKIMAERKAWEIAERTGLDVISILPAMCYGPNLQKEVSPSNITMLPLFHGSYIPLMFCYGGPVDVRDVAAAMILLYETPSASGRYICAESYAPLSDVMNLVAQLYPRHNIPQIENTQPWLARCKSPSKRLEALGFKFRPSSEGIIAALQEFEERGLIPKLDS
ncbi:protein MpDFR-like5 [Marchantia polymorpha subsp. ruderalis]|uniref:NAD-dependent epimerase/dehydratase domain-containing protein n=1 Tax=Marchantia polymorpha TaxID=3197 RepID=A0A2R6XDG5_MARPO|nr:hypothetical protein MARPO_0021s0024 [Marchantia polymorpha]BBN01218.1 hypothetical protein Mp_2g05680 [Marchantia polymorpha subsp. ruderalis]|eukprot:PTQ44142.1 hypothetical protein MARPO_0021s0024 [Marchantia polymorpha]